MTIEVELFDDLRAVERDAAGALDRSTVASLFDRLSWYRLIVRHCEVAGRPLIVRGRSDSGRAWMFLSETERRTSGLANWYTLAFAAVSFGDSGPILMEMARSLRRHGIATVRLEPVAEPEPLRAAFASGGWLARVRPSTANWRVRTAGRDFATYWSSRPPQLRATVRRKERKANLDIRIIRHFDAVAWSAYERVYAHSWKPVEGSPAFLRALAEMEGAAGTLRLGLAYKDGEPVAAQFWLVENGVATIHKLAHVETAREMSPGTLLSYAMFRHVIEEDRPEMIDFGTGDDRYKADWMDERRTLYAVEAFNLTTWAGLAAGFRAAAGSLVRRLRRD